MQSPVSSNAYLKHEAVDCRIQDDGLPEETAPIGIGMLRRSAAIDPVAPEPGDCGFEAALSFFNQVPFSQAPFSQARRAGDAAMAAPVPG